jgi:hypothetical protein
VTAADDERIVALGVRDHPFAFASMALTYSSAALTATVE